MTRVMTGRRSAGTRRTGCAAVPDSDALFFHLYGIDRDTADYILGTFPIVRREEEQRYGGRFRSRDLILGYMAARRWHPRSGGRR